MTITNGWILSTRFEQKPGKSLATIATWNMQIHPYVKTPQAGLYTNART